MDEERKDQPQETQSVEPDQTTPEAPKEEQTPEGEQSTGGDTSTLEPQPA